MIDFKKHFLKRYKLGTCDCWTLICDIYKDEHDLILPDYPYAIEDRESDFAYFVKANLMLEILDRPEKGAIMHYSHISEHVGYCLSDRQYIHRVKEGTKVQDIPSRHCKFYKVKGVINE